VASYFSSGGNYSATPGVFATTGIDNSPLHALSTAAAHGNGLYLYTSTPQMPTETYNGANYWVDVVYTLTGTGASVPTGLMSVANESTGGAAAGPSDGAATTPDSASSWGQLPPPATKGAALKMIALGLVKPHGSEHDVSFWCPLATTDPTVASAAITWNPEAPLANPPSTPTPVDSKDDASAALWLVLVGTTLLTALLLRKVYRVGLRAVLPRPLHRPRQAEAT
jgi:hypothetical protein